MGQALFNKTRQTCFVK